MAKQFHTLPEAVNHERLKSAFRRALPRWYRRHRRDLPWRRTADPYAIWVSEIMLQQTRVEVVQDYYRRWLKALPTVAALAQATPARVLKLWEGLGYYRRAQNLHRAAKIVTRRVRLKLTDAASQELRPPTGTIYPASVAAWQELPGIGPYTAAAIASIAFGERVPVVDGNVARVLARVFAVSDDVRQARTQRRLGGWAQELMPHSAPGDFNQAMMELGALVCTPSQPRCPDCPLRSVCRARAEGLVDHLPNRGRPAASRRVTMTAMIVRDGARFLVRRRPATGELAGMWELPAFDRQRFRRGRLLATVQHAIMDRRITLRVVAAVPVDGLPGTDTDQRWVTRQQAARLPFAAGHRRALEQVFSGSSQDQDGRLT